MDAWIYAADIYCEDCACDISDKLDVVRFSEVPKLPYEKHGDDYPQGPYADGGGEADTPNHCGSCGEFLENSLTQDGENYVRDAMTGDGDATVLAQWREFYSHLFEGE